MNPRPRRHTVVRPPPPRTDNQRHLSAVGFLPEAARRAWGGAVLVQEDAIDDQPARVVVNRFDWPNPLYFHGATLYDALVACILAARAEQRVA